MSSPVPAPARRRASHFFEWIAFAGFTGILRALSRDGARAVGAFLGRAAFDAFRVRRRVAVENVMLRLGPSGGKREAERIARASYEVFGRTYADMLRSDRIRGDMIWSAIDREGVTRVVEHASTGSGCILVSGHFGNWELFTIAASRLRENVGVIAGDQSNTRVGDAIVATRAKNGVRTFSSKTGVRASIRFLRERGMLCTLMDQDARRKGIFVPFLGLPASTHTGMLALAMREGMALFPIAILDQGAQARVIEGPSWNAREGISEEENLREGAELFSRFLEEQVRAHPEQYFWAHRRWKTRPMAGVPERGNAA